MEKKKPVSRKATMPAAKRASRKPAPAANQRNGDSDDIERAVYDGMQDLRARKPEK